MESRFRNNTLIQGNPYVGIDVGYFDEKAMQKQGRHDQARATYSQFAQTAADQAYLDQDAKDAYLKQQQETFDKVLEKHSGNLSAGFHDVLGAIETSKNSPYHNLNKRQMEQSRIQQELVSKYGVDAIDLSNVNKPLSKIDSDGNIHWSDPSEIKANVVKADNYSKVIEDMLAETAAHKFTKQTGLTGGAGNGFYLMSKITQGEVLSPEELRQIASDPSVQQAFLANASTAGIDNRNVPGTNLTYKEMLNDPNQLANFIYGNIQDKQRNNLSETKQFHQNTGAVMAARESSQKRVAKYTEDIKRQAIQGEPNIRVNLGVGEVNNQKKWLQLSNDKDKAVSQKEELSKANTELDKNLMNILGKDTPNLLNSDNSINSGVLMEMIKTNNPNLEQNEIDQMYNNARSSLLQRTANDNQLHKLDSELSFFNKIEEGIDLNIANPEYRKMYNSLSMDEKNIIARNIGIPIDNLTEDLFIKNKDNINKVLVGSGKRAAYEGNEYSSAELAISPVERLLGNLGNTEFSLMSKIEDTEKNIREKMENSNEVFKDLYVGLSNIDSKSAVGRYNKNWNTALSTVDPVTAINSFSTPIGGNILQDDPIAKELIQRAQDASGDKGNKFKLKNPTVLFNAGNNVDETPNTGYLIINYTDENGNDKSYTVRAKSEQNASVFREYENALISDAYNTTYRSLEEEQNAKGTAFTIKGKGLYGDRIINAWNAVDKGYAQQQIEMYKYLETGERVKIPVFVSKGVDAFGDSKFFISLPGRKEPFEAQTKEEAINLTAEIGGKAFVINNPKMAENFTITNKQYYKPVFKD